MVKPTKKSSSKKKVVRKVRSKKASPTRAKKQSKKAVKKVSPKKAVKKTSTKPRASRVQKTELEKLQAKHKKQGKVFDPDAMMQRQAARARDEQKAQTAEEAKQQSRLKSLLASGWTPEKGNPTDGMKILGFDVTYEKSAPRVNKDIQVVDDYITQEKYEGRTSYSWSGVAIAPSEEALKMWLHSLGTVSTWKGEDMMNIEDLEVTTGPQVRKLILASLYGNEFFLQMFPNDANLLQRR
jgi:hypothetical protein